ncbi:MAG: hypothetical protein QOJ46_2059 [bacterium]|jgi:EmrB/QacA subfamily drug resistance transporter
MSSTGNSEQQAAQAAAAAKRVLLVASGATFMAFLDITVVNIAFPDMHASFASTTVSDLSWVVSIYAVLFAALLTPAGQLADVIGRRRLFLSGLLVFVGASAICAVAPDVTSLIVARAVQGAAAAAMIPAALGMVLAAAPPERRAAAVGLWAASSALASAIGPSLGGLLVDVWGWRAVFVINVPVGIAIALAAMRALPSERPAPRRLPDLVGTLLGSVAIGLLVAGLTKGGDWGWSSGSTVGTLGAGAVLATLAVLRARHHPAPAIEMDLWRNRTFAMTNVTSLLFGASVFAFLLLGALFLTAVWHYSILETGLAVSPGALAAAVAAVVVGRRASPRAQRMTVSGGAVVMAATCVWMYAALGDEPRFFELWLPGGLLSGAAIGATFTALATLAVSSVSPTRFASATGMNMTARQLGGALGVAALAAIVGASVVPATQGLLDVYLFCALAAAAAAISGLALLESARSRARAGAPGPRAVAAGGEQ